MGKTKCVLYMRVSKNDDSQNTENQRGPLRKLAETLGLEVVREYEDYSSGGNSNRPQFQEMLKDAKARKFEIILVWSLDRFSREGISNTLHYIETLKNSRVAFKSLTESWIDTRDEGIGQVVIALLAWGARQEREKIKERTRAGLAIARENGKILGRPKGSGDKKRRVRSGYFLRHLRNRNAELVVNC